MYDIAAQLVGFAGMALCVSCFFCKDSGRLLLRQLLGNSLFLVQFLMLGAYSGCVNVAILVASSLVVVFRIKGRPWAAWRGWPWLWCALILVSTAAAWQGWLSLLPCVSTIAFVLINWTGNANWIRLGKLAVVGPGWMIYDAFAGSLGGVISEGIGLCSALVSLIYYRRAARSPNQDTAEAAPQQEVVP